MHEHKLGDKYNFASLEYSEFSGVFFFGGGGFSFKYAVAF